MSERQKNEMSEGDGDLTKKQDAEKLLQQGKTIQVYPSGYSMYPLLVPGRDQAVIAPVRFVRRGEVYLYRRDQDILVLHRLFRKTQEGLYFVGDNQTEVEGPLREDQLRGQLVGIVRNGHELSRRNVVYRGYCVVWLLLRPFRSKIAKAIHSMKLHLGGKGHA